MDISATIPVSVHFGGRHYQGTVTPSKKKGLDGKPLYFRVMVNNEFFCFLSRGDDGWNELNGDRRRKTLVEAIGECIAAHYDR